MHLRDAEEGGVPAVQERPVDDLQDEGEVLQGQQRDGSTHGEQQTLDDGQKQRQTGGLQVGVAVALVCNTVHMCRTRGESKSAVTVPILILK